MLYSGMTQVKNMHISLAIFLGVEEYPLKPWPPQMNALSLDSVLGWPGWT